MHKDEPIVNNSSLRLNKQREVFLKAKIPEADKRLIKEFVEERVLRHNCSEEGQHAIYFSCRKLLEALQKLEPVASEEHGKTLRAKAAFYT